MFDFADDSVCKACGVARLTFEPPSLYCTACGQRIKRNQVRTQTSGLCFLLALPIVTSLAPHQQVIVAGTAEDKAVLPL